MEDNCRMWIMYVFKRRTTEWKQIKSMKYFCCNSNRTVVTSPQPLWHLTVPMVLYRNFKFMKFDVFSTVHHSIELFHLPTLMHNSLFINNCMLHYYPRYVWALICQSSGGQIVFTQHLLSSLSVNSCTVHRLRADFSQPVSCADVYRERRYQMLCEYNLSS